MTIQSSPTFLPGPPLVGVPGTPWNTQILRKLKWNTLIMRLKARYFKHILRSSEKHGLSGMKQMN